MRFFAIKTVVTPSFGMDSISEGTISKWQIKPGEFVKTDDVVVEIETDKIAVSIRASESGVLKEQLIQENKEAKVGAPLYVLDTDAKVGTAAPRADVPKPAQPTQTQASPPTKAPSAQPTQPTQPAQPAQPATKPATPTTTPQNNVALGSRSEHKVRMPRIRKVIADRLKGAQDTYAMLTTFQEADMTNLMALRKEFADEFLEKHKIKLGFMSCFVKAAAQALKDQPIVNAVINGDEILYRDYIDISVAVAGPNGLIVPVLRDCDRMSFADVEKAIIGLSNKAKDGTLAIEDMVGGTFTISNGGVYGSMMGTPIINPPQSAILGMHAITKRAVVVNDQIVIRPMMYLALTYDHRLIDGREAVTFLRKIKAGVEDPRKMLLDM